MHSGQGLAIVKALAESSGMLHRQRETLQRGNMMTETADAQAIVEIGERYYQAMVAGNEAALRALFDARAPIIGYYQGQLLWLSLQDFIDEATSLVGQHGPERCQVETHRIDGDIGFVAVAGQYAQAWLIDHLLLSRGSDGWKILSKTFHVT